MSNEMISVGYWGMAMTIPFAFTFFAEPMWIKIFLFAMVNPLVLSFLSKQPQFIVSDRVILAAGITTLIVAYLASLLEGIKKNLQDPYKNKLTGIATYMGVVAVFLIVMFMASNFFGMYPKSGNNF